MKTAQMHTRFDRTTDKIQTLENRVNQSDKRKKLQDENLDKKISVIGKYN